MSRPGQIEQVRLLPICPASPRSRLPVPQLILVWSKQRSLVVLPVQPWSERPGMTWTSLRGLSCLLTLAVALPAAAAESSQRDGTHDFDFAHGKWKIHVKKLKAPLKGSKD